MPFEYQLLVFMTVFFLFAWFPSSIGKWKSFGTKWINSNRTPLAGRELLPWAARTERAHNNLKDNFPGFVIAIILLGQLNKFDEGTKWAATLYVLFRLSHFITYGIGSVRGRALSYFAALIANLYLLIKVLI